MKLGLYNHLSEFVPFVSDARSSLLIGKPKTGKSTTLIRLALDSIYENKPIVFFDPRGSAVDEILKHIPNSRQKDVLYFNPSLYPFPFNILYDVQEKALFTTTVLETVKGVWGYDKTPTPNIDQYIRAGIATLLEYPSTLLDLKFLLTDTDYRTHVLNHVTDCLLKDFWHDFEKMTDKEQRQETASTLNKIRAFIFEPLVRNCIDQQKNKLSFTDTIVLVSLKDGELGAENASLLGALILAQLYVDGVRGLPTTLFIDGAHRFGTAILGNILTNCPNVETHLTLQYLDQLSRDFQPTLLGSVEQIIAFKTSVRDAKILEPEFDLTNDQRHLFELHPFTAYVGSTLIHTVPHNYMIPKKPRNTKKAVQQRIIDRCKALSGSREEIEKRLGRFFE